MKQQHPFWKGKAVYAALGLVVAGAALASFLAINSMMVKLGTADSASPAAPSQSNTTQTKEDNVWDSSKAPAETKQENVPVSEPEAMSNKGQGGSSASSSTQPLPSASSAAPSVSAEPSAPEESQTAPYTLPVTGSVLQAFSGDELVFNTTMQDWRTHNGVDFAVGASTPVTAPMNAKVTAMDREDPLWGGVVELTDDSGTVIRLCGLDKISVSQDMQVKQGDTLGIVGEVPCEAESESHVHVEVLQNGAYIDPQQVLPAA